ncbi:MAG: hypothetical protein AMS27_12640 [Bacteroides sp. SM23_62_1]|nr:MAG: hypothetical protein AMS27_12640 [Bacteroides sp. SM23_62_1]
MYRNYLITILRNIARQKLFSFISIFGLATGLTCFLIIFFWIRDELSYDRYHSKAENIYRVYEKQYYSGGETFVAFATPEPLAQALRETFPEIVNATRLNLLWEKLLFRYEDRIFNETRVYASDQATFDMFSFQLLAGRPENALTEPYSMIMTESMSKKYFGEDDPVGKSVVVNNEYIFTVTGVMEDVPHNSHVRWECLVPFEFMLEIWNYPKGFWGSNTFRTYIEIREGISEEEVERKIIDLIQKNYEGSTTELYLQPLLETHLYALEGSGPIQYIRIFSIVALFVLIIACINFMILSTARSTRRAKEVGIRKVVGASKNRLVIQFFGESLLFALLSLFLAILLTEILRIPFNNLSGKDLSFDFFSPEIFPFLLLLVIFTGILAGSFPAQLLSSFKAVDVLKGIYQPGSLLFRKLLIIIQFVVSIVLIICTMLIYKQLQYIRNKDIGLDKNNIIYFPLRDFSNFTPFKEALKTLPGVENVSATNRVPLSITNSSWAYDWEGKDPDLEILFQQIYVDFDYFETFKMEMLEGRTFSIAFPSDSANYILNEESVRRMGISDPVGSYLYHSNREGIVVGIVKDFNFHHLSRPIDPLILAIEPPRWEEVIIRIDPHNLDNSLEEIEKTWKVYFPGEPFEYQFLDEEYDRMYRAEERMGKIFNYFAILAIVLSCLGLFGLASFMTDLRTREIGIRKTFGSSVLNIFLIMNRPFVIWILISNLIAIPAAWYTMTRWLQDWAFKTSISWWIFLLAALISLVIAILTVTFQSIRSAHTNPAKTLRYE